MATLYHQEEFLFVILLAAVQVHWMPRLILPARCQMYCFTLISFEDKFENEFSSLVKCKVGILP